MPRKTPPSPPDFVFDHDNLIPPSQVVPEHKEQYWTALMDAGLDAIRAACAAEEFFPLLREIPKAFWEKRFFVYLYRQWPKVKNAEKDKYIDKYPRPIDEGEVKEEHGGGGYLAYLNLDGKEQLKQITFAIDGPPKFKPGQVLVDGAGNPLPTTAAPVTPAVDSASQLVSAASAGAAASVEIVKEGYRGLMETQNDLTRKQLGLDGAQKDPLELAIRLIEVLHPKAPAADPVQAKLMEKIIDRAFAEPAEEKHAAKEETKLEEVSGIVEMITGRSLAEIAKGAKPVVASETPWYAPLVNGAVTLGASLLEKWPLILAQQNENLRLQLQMRAAGVQPQPGQPQLMPAPGPEIVRRGPPPPPTGTIQPLPTGTAQAQQPAAPDPGQIMQAVVRMVIDGFKRAPIGEFGHQAAGAIDFHFGEQLEAMGLAPMLGNPEELKKFVDGIPELKQLRDTDVRWTMYEADFLAYTSDRWGLAEDEQETEPEKKGPQPAA